MAIISLMAIISNHNRTHMFDPLFCIYLCRYADVGAFDEEDGRTGTLADLTWESVMSSVIRPKYLEDFFLA